MGARPLFFRPGPGQTYIIDQLRTTIETRLAAAEPAVEVVLLEQLGGDRVRLFVDHPDGVDLALCERVTRQLSDLLGNYAIEVSSPGLDRPLTKPEHFTRFVGRQVRVRTRDAIDGHRSFTGTLLRADDGGVAVEVESGAITIPHESIQRSNLVPDAVGGNR